MNFLRMPGLHNPEGKNIMLLGSGCTAGIPQSGACKRTGTPVSRKRMGKGKKRDYPYLPGIEGSDV